ncbi:succinate dehydrogenase, cytochrome b556 subunit [Brevundimonas sp. NPDC092305]|uniref:succinate dehydrogenase, cytochrome b556 subunit n=1 Tax=Brevundimonas sp. NPDC092305 TaxID=3363957 RepID=UPI00382491BB
MSSSPLPGDASNDPTDDQTGRFVRQPNGRVRPLSPHMQIWRWHITMVASIAFRVTIGAATFGAMFVIGWLAVLAFGPEAHATFAALAGSPLGLLIGIGLTWVLFSFMLNGGRHLINDATIGLELKPADLMSHIAVWGPFVLTAILWIVLFATGRVSL